MLSGPVQVFSQQLLHSSRVEPLLLSSLGVTRNLLILLVELQVEANVGAMLPTGTERAQTKVMISWSWATADDLLIPRRTTQTPIS